MIIIDLIFIVLLSLFYIFSGCCALFALESNILIWAMCGVLSLLASGIVFLASRNISSKRLRFCRSGYLVLSAFCVSCAICLGIYLYGAHLMLFDQWKQWLLCSAVCVAVHTVVYAAGIVTLYLTSVQLGIKYRAAMIILGWIPIINAIILGCMIWIVRREVYFEDAKNRLNQSREHEQVCRTKYPILLVHGVCFRDSQLLNYWGRIPSELIKNGATVFYGNQQSAASVVDCAHEIKHRIEQIIEKTGCEKVNIIAHSKGGLDSRYAISCLGMAPYVASLTTINTPHRGCEYADYLLGKISSGVQKKVGDAYNYAMKKIGDHDPDFLAAMNDLSAAGCAELNQKINDEQGYEGMLRQSYGSCINRITSGRFPFNLTYGFVRLFEGANDGLVSEKSFAWGEKYTLLKVPGRHGISHVDIIDLYRENIKGFDVREFYVQLVADLKQSGM